MPNDWQSYDAAAGTHERLAVPNFFTPPARDLVASLELPSAETVLDVGTGSGVAARLAKEASNGTVVVGLDPSFEMLRVARSHGLYVVGGTVPGLPFPPGTFDRVMASFVLSHISSYKEALADMTRVLTPKGKIGVTCWGPLHNEFRDLWQSIADSFAGKETLQGAVAQALPWEAWFEEPAHLEQAFHEAGLREVKLSHTHYSARMSIADFLEIRADSLQARFMRRNFNRERWEQFKGALSAEFYMKFEDPIEYARDAHIAIGTK